MINGVVYRMEIIGTDKFYIGLTTQDINTYWGSGKKWNNYLDDNNIPRDSEHINKIVLRENIHSWDELKLAEAEEIHKFCVMTTSNKWKKKPEYENIMLNEFLYNYPMNTTPCEHCGSINSVHKKGCPELISSEGCTCGTPRGGFHTKECPLFKPVVCSECKGRSNRHKKSCSKYRPIICPDCGGKSGQHKKGCKKYKPRKHCELCGGVPGAHKKGCKYYKDPQNNVVCNECNGKHGLHYSHCSHYKFTDKCPHCGSKHGMHKKDCPDFNGPVCELCGGVYGKHKKDCDLVKKCELCGGTHSHYKTCPKYKYKDCPDCGGKHGRHTKQCIHYKQK